MSTHTIQQTQGFVYDRDIEMVAQARNALGVEAEELEYVRDRCPGYNEIAGEFAAMTPEQREAAEREIDDLLERPKQRKHANIAAHRYDRVASAEAAAATARGRSAEAGPEERQPIASSLALELGEGPTDDDVAYVHDAACDIFGQLATLADRFPRRCRRSDRGDWVPVGPVADTLDAMCATLERRWERADQAAERALRALHQAEASDVETEIGRQQLTDAEDKAAEAHEQALFFRALFDAARRTYEVVIGDPWITRQKMSQERARLMGLANTTIRQVTVYTPPKPAACTRVVVMGGGADFVDELETALHRLSEKHKALTLYSGDREQGIEHQVARWAMGRCQLVRFGLERERDGNAAPFRRAERMLEAAEPHGVIVVGPRDHGPTAHLANVARERGIKVWDLRQPAKAPAATA